MKKSIISLVGLIIVVLMILMAYVGPWYVINIKSPYLDVEYEANINMYLTEIKVDGNIPGLDLEAQGYSDYSDGGNNKTIVNNVKNMVFASIITAILAVLSIVGSMFSTRRPNTLRMLGFCFGIITFILSVVAIFYFMGTVPSEMAAGASDSNFWYSQTTLFGDMTMGPGYAWYAMLISAIFSIISSALLLMEEKIEIVKSDEY